jgi:hypothetical protein
MRCLPRSTRNTFLNAVVVLACLVLTSCGTTCVAGIFANGTGIILVKNSTPPPACPFSSGVGMMNVVAIKSQVCETCTASSRPQHIFVTLKSIQLHSAFPDSLNSRQWFELASPLLREHRQIDLLSDSAPEILVQNAPVPSNTYPELLLQFLPDTLTDPDALATESSCGRSRRNCMLMADGHVEELHFAGNGDSSELLLPLEYNGSSALAVVPGAVVDLRLRLQPQQVSTASASGSLQIYYVVVGSASISR